MNQHVRCALSALLATVSVSVPVPLRADVTISDDVSPASAADPWDLGDSPLLVGGTIPGMPRSGSVLVSNKGRVLSPSAIIGGPYEGSGTVEVVGYGSRWTNNGSLAIGAGHFAWGSLIVRRGARVITDDLRVSGPYFHAYGDVLVEGYDATLTSRTNAYIGDLWGGRIEIRKGASFFSHNVYFGASALPDPFLPIEAFVTGSATRWVSTGEFVVGAGRAAQLTVYRGELSTVNARVLGNGRENSVVRVSGWDGTWTNAGLLSVGGDHGIGGIVLGALGTLATEEAEIRSRGGAAYIYVTDVYASWINSGDVTILASMDSPVYPALHIDGGGSVRIDGLLRLAPLPGAPGGPRWAVRLADGELTAAEIEVQASDNIDLYRGRLETSSFTGDLANPALGTLVVGEVYPSTSVAGSYSQGSFATLSLTVAGPSAAPLLFVDGDASLDGALEIHADDEAMPFQAGDTIAVLGWSGALLGTFSEVTIDVPLAPGLAWDTSALYTTGEIVVVPG
ncbi:hypothetical protein [Sorangium sp. So ce124]|uniref:hypothetical protein n=1 Tax=Sorangium sp. So ce124 TaxID=3133280 RepID=UPI003F5F734F